MVKIIFIVDFSLVFNIEPFTKSKSKFSLILNSIIGGGGEAPSNFRGFSSFICSFNFSYFKLIID